MRVLVGGKGGTGKTVIAGLIVRALAESSRGPILGVDADPDSNLGEALGIEVGSTLGQIREDLLQSQRDLPPGVDKGVWLESKIYEIMAEGDKFDLLTMGRPEGPGCYCAVNNILRALLDQLSDAYPYVVIDAEAGLEHLSRRTTGSVDELLVVTDPSVKGFQTAKRMLALADGMGSRYGRFHLIVNRVADGSEAVQRLASDVDLAVELEVPEDPEVRRADLEGRSVFTLSQSSAAWRTVKQFVEKEIIKEA